MSGLTYHFRQETERDRNLINLNEHFFEKEHSSIEADSSCDDDRAAFSPIRYKNIENLRYKDDNSAVCYQNDSIDTIAILKP